MVNLSGTLSRRSVKTIGHKVELNETHSTPRLIWQMEIPGPAWAKYLSNIIVTAAPLPGGQLQELSDDV